MSINDNSSENQLHNGLSANESVSESESQQTEDSFPDEFNTNESMNSGENENESVSVHICEYMFKWFNSARKKTFCLHKLFVVVLRIKIDTFIDSLQLKCCIICVL